MQLKDNPNQQASNQTERENQTSIITSDKLELESKSSVSSPLNQQSLIRLPITKKISQGWNDLSLQWKLTSLLIITAGIPALVITQVMTKVTEDNLLRDLRTSLQEKNTLFTEEYILWTQEESKADANTITQSIQNAGIDLSNPQQVLEQRNYLQSLLQLKSDVPPESIKSFKIITDLQGRTIAQNGQILADNFKVQPSLSPKVAKGNSGFIYDYKPVALPSSISLGTIPIVKDSLATGTALDGIELVKSESLQLLGLDQQANIGIRPQQVQGLPEPKQPSPDGTYDIDQGKVGLVSMAVYPIKFKGRLVGTAIVGSLLNRNYGLVDKFTQKHNIPVATVFAQDWRVTTNVPYIDVNTKSPDNTRAIGTKVSREVAAVVLGQGKNFLGETNIVGVNYLTAYAPLYDHQKLLNPQAKPVGIAFIGRPLSEIQEDLGGLQRLGYGIGLLSLALAGIVGAGFAGTFSRPVRRLARFTQQVGDGEVGMRLEATNRKDEIGILSQELNKMATNIETNLETLRLESERVKLFSAIASTRAVEAKDLESIFSQAVQGARQILNADRVVIYRFNPDWSGYLSHESVGADLPSALAEKATDPCIPQTLIEAYRQGRIVPTNDMSERDYHPDHRALLSRLQIKANLVTPIVQQDKLFGILVAHHCYQTHVWQQEEIDFLQQLAVQIGLSLDRVGFLDQLDQSRMQSEGLAADQKQEKETLQRRALELLMEVDPVSKGDLTIRAKVTADEIGTIADSYNAIIRSLRQIVEQVQDSAKSVTDTAVSSEATVDSLSTDAKRQAEAITGALKQIQSMAESNQGVANRAQQAAKKVQQASQTVQAGDLAMNRTVDGISAIRETVANTAKKVKRLGEASQKISKVVNLIGNFASQTNLLALNAAIEAARAGEEGRGFAVVAEEVRSLAQQSAAATAEIEELVEEIQSQTNDVVAAMESGTEQVVVGTQLVEETRQQLSQINAVSAEISKLVREIAQASVTQTQASSAVTQTMQEVAAIANGTSEQSEAVSDSFTQLIQVAQDLQVSVAQFKLV